MNREAMGVGRDRIARLMSDLGLAGARRGKFKRTTISDPTVALPSDLVDRHFAALGPNRLWVADITHVSTWSGFNYVAFVTHLPTPTGSPRPCRYHGSPPSQLRTDQRTVAPLRTSVSDFHSVNQFFSARANLRQLIEEQERTVGMVAKRATGWHRRPDT
jgi:hypothetical protein